MVVEGYLVRFAFPEDVVIHKVIAGGVLGTWKMSVWDAALERAVTLTHLKECFNLWKERIAPVNPGRLCVEKVIPTN